MSVLKQGTTILTLDNGYHLWSHTDGDDDSIHLLALHGGPGGNHEYWENFHDELLKQGLNVQVHYYDQLAHGILINQITPILKSPKNIYHMITS